jgi:hypothetical protein
MGRYGLNSSGSGCGPLDRSCEHGNETSGSIKRWENFGSCTTGSL